MVVSGTCVARVSPQGIYVQMRVRLISPRGAMQCIDATSGAL